MSALRASAMLSNGKPPSWKSGRFTNEPSCFTMRTPLSDGPTEAISS